MTDKDKEIFEKSLQYIDDPVPETNEEELEKDKSHALMTEILETPIIPISMLRKMPKREDRFLVDRFVSEGDTILILAKEKVGKSIVALQMACCISAGEPFLDNYHVDRPRRVLYVQTESNRHHMQDVYERMTLPSGVPVNEDNFYYYYSANLSLHTPEGFAQFKQTIIDSGFDPEVIFLDPLYSCTMGAKLEKAEVASQFLGHINELKEIFNCTVLIMHHEKKVQSDGRGGRVDLGSDSFFGAYTWSANVSHIIRMTAPGNSKLRRKISCDTQRTGDIIENMNLVIKPTRPFMLAVEGSFDKPEYYNTVLQCIQANKEPLTFKEMETLCQDFFTDIKCPNAAVKRATYYWVRQKKVVQKYVGCPTRWGVV